MANTNAAASKVRMLEPLTSFRFLAALLVFTWHVHSLRIRLEKFEFGYVGVSFFFVLSGFILTYVYYSRLNSGNKTKIKNFYASRIAKLYPVHILTFFVSIPIVLQAFSYIFPTFTKLKFLGISFLELTLTQSYSPSNNVNFAFNGVAWSISDELFFYLLFPLLIYMVARYAKVATPKRLLLGLMALWVVLVSILATRHAVIDEWAYYIFPPFRLFDFVFGMAIALLFLRLTTLPKSIVHRLHVWQFTTIEVLAVAILTCAILISPLLPQTLRFGLFLIPFWGMLIFVFAWQSGLISRILSNKILVFLGNVSFSFYMIHELVIVYLEELKVGHLTILSLALSLVLSSVVYKFYEEPLRLRVKKYLERISLASATPLKILPGALGPSPDEQKPSSLTTE